MRNVRGQIAYSLLQCCAILVLSFDVVGTATGQDAFVSADLDLHKLDMRDEISHKDAILALEKIVEGDFSSISQFFLKSVLLLLQTIELGTIWQPYLHGRVIYWRQNITLKSL